MDLDNPIRLSLVIDAGRTPLRGVLECSGEDASEFHGMLQLLELIGRIVERQPGSDLAPTHLQGR